MDCSLDYSKIKPIPPAGELLAVPNVATANTSYRVGSLEEELHIDQ